MINVVYVGSSGNVYNLQLSGMIRIKDANFHEYEWEYDATDRRYGVAIDRFTKAAAVYEMEFTIYGGRDTRRDTLKDLHDEFERDVVMQTPGRIVWGDSYIEGYVIQSSTYPDDNLNFRTANKIAFLAPYPFWIQEKSISIEPLDETIVRDIDKKYTADRYAYPYGYTINPITTWISLDYYTSCDFKLIAYGPFASVYVTVGSNVYNVDYPADISEYMVIDSRSSGNLKGQAYLVRPNGQKINVFDYRNPLYPLFQKIPAGGLRIAYPRTYGIDLTFFMERSEPVINATGDDYATILNNDGLPLTAKIGG